MRSIAFDIDNTILELTPILRKYIYKYVNHDIGDSWVYHFAIPGLTEFEVGNLIKKIIKYHTIEAEPSNNSIKYLQKFFDLDKENPLLFITARNENDFSVDEWFKKNINSKFPYIIIKAGSHDKSKYLENIKYFVDDRYESIDTLLSVVDKVFLINKSYNSKFKINNDNVIRVNDLKDCYNLYMKYTKMKQIAGRNT